MTRAFRVLSSGGFALSVTLAVAACGPHGVLPENLVPETVRRWANPPQTAARPAPPTPPLTRTQAAAMLAEARELIARQDYPRARGSLRGVVPEAERRGWHDIDSDAHFILGETLDRERASREAADAYEQAYQASRRLADPAREIRSLNALSNSLLDAGDYREASTAAVEASSLAHHQGDLRAEATAQNNIAEGHRLAGRLEAARDSYQRALALARQAGDPAAIASILINLGSTERRVGRLGDARVRFGEAQDLTRSLNDTRANEYVQWHLKQIEAELAPGGGQP
jgi:tetratricopeptide (TPR) repeat protein